MELEDYQFVCESDVKMQAEPAPVTTHWIGLSQLIDTISK